MDLLNGKITELHKNYENNSTMKIESNLYEYVSYNQNGYITLKNKSTSEEANYPLLKDNSLNSYTIITVFD